jgi:hypothetical protein
VFAEEPLLKMALWAVASLSDRSHPQTSVMKGNKALSSPLAMNFSTYAYQKIKVLCLSEKP